MKIGTWNLERLKYYKKTAEITSLLESQNCDILVLTEYDERIKPKGFEFEISTKNVAEVNTEFYQVTEKRVKIFTKYEIIKEFETYDCFTSCCAELKTENKLCGKPSKTLLGFSPFKVNFQPKTLRKIENRNKLCG